MESSMQRGEFSRAPAQQAGIDVSYYQGKIDWAAVAGSGVRFAMLKATQGHLRHSSVFGFNDPMWERNITGAAGAGLACGAYHYLTAQNVEEARAEADYFVSQLAPHRSRLRLWAAVDVEDDDFLGRLDAAGLTQVTDVFCRRVEEAGFRPMVYTNPNYIRYKYRVQPNWPLWLALWRSPTVLPTGYRDLKLWQYGVGRSPGVTGDVDMNLGFFEEEHMNEAEEKKDNTPEEWSRDAVAWAVREGILYGDEHGNLRLREPCTREAAVTFLYRALGGGR